MNALTEFKSYSQAGQDRFVYETLRNTKQGTFLDIGCCHPIEQNNTYALEKMGWRGLLIDMDNVAELCIKHRTSPFVQADATCCDFAALLKHVSLTSPIDYLSLDVDAASLATLRNLPLEKFRFRAITIEHDRYRFGQLVADIMRGHLSRFGYTLVQKDVCSQGLPFEDWWIHESFTP